MNSPYLQIVRCRQEAKDRSLNKAKIRLLNIRFRTLGCYPLTGATKSHADTTEDIILELLTVNQSKRKGDTNKKNPNPSAKKQKKAGYI